MFLSLVVGLKFRRVGLVVDDGNEENPRPFQETGPVKGLPEWVVTPCVRVGVEEELRVSVPEDFVGGELEKDFGVGAHVHGIDCGSFPWWEGWGE